MWRWIVRIPVTELAMCQDRASCIIAEVPLRLLLPEGGHPPEELNNQIILNGNAAVVGTLDVVAAVAVDGQVLIGQ